MQPPPLSNSVFQPAPPRLAAPPERWPALLVVASGLGAAVALFAFNPSDYHFYPVCFFHRLTGLDCPGCGTLRAAHQLLHGHLREAFALNPLALLLGPLLGWSLGAWLMENVLGSKVKQPFTHPAWIWGIGAGVLLFGIARNLPVLHLSSLAR